MELKQRKYSQGMAIVEIIMSTMLVALMLVMMVPAAVRMVNEAKEDKTVTDLKEIQAQIEAFEKDNSRYPISLVEIYESVPLDSWGNPYQYLDLSTNLPGTQGKARKNKNMKLINSDYDLYSIGPDAQSVAPLTAKPSRDDIIRGHNGRYIGPVMGFE